MGRRKRQPKLSDILLESPWWVSVALGFCAYIAFHAIVPAVLGANRYLAGLTMASREFAWVPALVFCFLGLVSFVKARVGERPVAENARALRRRPVALAKVKPATAPAVGSTAPSEPASALQPPQGWSLEALALLEWKRFELLCVAYYEQLGFTVETVPHGADGGIDATLYRQGMEQPMALVQCKAWQSPVRVEPVRALGGVMHQHKIRRGVFWSLSGYSGEAKKYAAAADIQLLDGAGIVERILKLEPSQQAALLARAFEGDYRTPTCAACGVKLVRRTGRRGPFWGCSNYPAGCRVTMEFSA
ncbi:MULTISPECIES: restriction endonuclease [Cupriavidus]